MTYANDESGRVDLEASSGGSPASGGAFWTFDMVEERLIEAMLLWKRSPGGGKWPFASDAPWQLMTRSTRIAEGRIKGMDLARLLQEDDARETAQWQGRERPRPLSRDEVARRDEASEWLGWVSADARRVVVLALVQLERKDGIAGAANDGRRANQIDWARVKAALGCDTTNKGVYRRYTRAIAAIVARLNRGETAR